MLLYFVRHGEAEPARGKTDEERELTAAGLAQVQRAAGVIQRMAVQVEVVYCSPRARAQQTAAQLAQALNRQVEVSRALDFDFGPSAVTDFVHAHSTADLMFVGHEPTMSNTLETITGARVIMRPGSIACVELTSRATLRGELVWFGSPGLMDALAGS